MLTIFLGLSVKGFEKEISFLLRKMDQKKLVELKLLGGRKYQFWLLVWRWRSENLNARSITVALPSQPREGRGELG